MDDWLVRIEGGQIRGEIRKSGSDDPTVLDGGSYALDGLLEDAVKVLESLLRQGRFGDREGVQLLGRILYEALFKPSEELSSKFKERMELRGGDPFVLRLQIDDRDADELPWELLCRGDAALATEDKPILVRYRPASTDIDRFHPPAGVHKPGDEVHPLKVMFAVVQPDGILTNIVREYRAMRKRVGPPDRSDVDRRLLEVEELSNKVLVEQVKMIVSKSEYVEEAHKDAIMAPIEHVPAVGGDQDAVFDTREFKAVLDNTRPAVLHFIGHGRPHSRKPALIAFPETADVADARTKWIDPGEFALMFRDVMPPPALVVLHLCQATIEQVETSFRHFAAPLMDKGVEAVVAMQYPLHTSLAHDFVSGFYSHLRAGETVERAVQAGRRKVWDETLFGSYTYYRDFAAPVLYMRRKSLKLVDVVASEKGLGRAGVRESLDRPGRDGPSQVMSRGLVDRPTRSRGGRFSTQTGEAIHG